MMELADMQDLGSCAFGVGVQVPIPAPGQKPLLSIKTREVFHAFRGKILDYFFGFFAQQRVRQNCDRQDLNLSKHGNTR